MLLSSSTFWLHARPCFEYVEKHPRVSPPPILTLDRQTDRIFKNKRGEKKFFFRRKGENDKPYRLGFALLYSLVSLHLPSILALHPAVVGLLNLLNPPFPFLSLCSCLLLLLLSSDISSSFEGLLAGWHSVVCWYIVIIYWMARPGETGTGPERKRGESNFFVAHLQPLS